MAWITIPNNSVWEYDNDPADPGGAETTLWEKQTDGIRTNSSGTEIYTKCRIVGTTVDTSGELNKTYWDARGDEVQCTVNINNP